MIDIEFQAGAREQERRADRLRVNIENATRAGNQGYAGEVIPTDKYYSAPVTARNVLYEARGLLGVTKQGPEKKKIMRAQEVLDYNKEKYGD